MHCCSLPPAYRDRLRSPPAGSWANQAPATPAHKLPPCASLLASAHDIAAAAPPSKASMEHPDKSAGRRRRANNGLALGRVAVVRLAVPARDPSHQRSPARLWESVQRLLSPRPSLRSVLLQPAGSLLRSSGHSE